MAVLSAMSVLVVDDNDMSRRIQSSLIRKLGYPVTEANSGQQALDLLMRDSSFQLVFMDMEMPLMDGVETTKHIRARGLQLPIVAVTGNNTEEDKQRCRLAGMNGFVTKPVKPDVLQSILQRYCSA